MNIANKLRIATMDTANAMEIACGEVESAIGVPVQAEFQEIDGMFLIVKLRLVEYTERSPHPHRLALTTETSASNVEVLSSWRESNALRPKARFCHEVLGVDFDTVPSVALIGLLSRRGYARRFASLDITALKLGLAS